MRVGFYPKLAWTGITKNRKTTLPYILTCTGMVMMFYIISFLSKNDAVLAMPGGGVMQLMLSLGCGVIGVFALIFLFYTHSFLIRRRKKEFGLYNILGMGKRNLARIMVWESLTTAAISLSGGLFCGVLFSKVAELCMAHMLGGEIGFSFTIETSSVLQTLLLFIGIHVLILLNTLRQIHVSKPVELLNGEAVGEKPPKANWILAVSGVVILAGAYYIAVTSKDAVTAIFLFFIAVVMVVIGTYLLFIAGSVTVCKLLQKHKAYYYKTSHFISVSSMVYRMKRNGAGLATICILSTMVLVMISSTVCLYIGAEDSLRNRYPRNIVVETAFTEHSQTRAVHDIIDNTLDQNGLSAENILYYRYLGVAGYFNADQVILDQNKLPAFQYSASSGTKQMYFIPLEDYNRLMGEQKTLDKDEVLIFGGGTDYPYDSINIESCTGMRVKEVVPDFIGSHMGAMLSIPSMIIIVPDMDFIEAVYEKQSEVYGTNRSERKDYYGFDLNCENDKQKEVYQDIYKALQRTNSDSFPKASVESASAERGNFYALYGGLFFLGILLGIVFVFAAVLIMYYKQISEGYEDQFRFEIMQKVGMTKREIRKSINSQVLTVFFMPLVTAGIHIAFAFPFITKLLALFNLNDIGLLATSAVVCYLIFALFYALVYWITSGAYYGIVSSKEKALS